jgi:hypothetical protein
MSNRSNQRLYAAGRSRGFRNKFFEFMDKHFFKVFIVFGVIIALSIVAGVTVGITKNFAQTTQTCTISDKDMTKDSGGTSVYQVYTEDCGTLRVSDNMFMGVWDSADIYGSLRAGQTYEVKTVGWRVPILSMFPEIVEVK